MNQGSSGVGLTGPDDISLTFARDDVRGGLARVAGLPPLANTPDSDPGAPPSILPAIQEQFGLKLEGTKAPVEVMVINHIEKPSPNSGGRKPISANVPTKHNSIDSTTRRSRGTVSRLEDTLHIRKY